MHCCYEDFESGVLLDYNFNVDRLDTLNIFYEGKIHNCNFVTVMHFHEHLVSLVNGMHV